MPEALNNTLYWIFTNLVITFLKMTPEPIYPPGYWSSAPLFHSDLLDLTTPHGKARTDGFFPSHPFPSVSVYIAESTAISWQCGSLRCDLNMAAQPPQASVSLLWNKGQTKSPDRAPLALIPPQPHENSPSAVTHSFTSVGILPFAVPTPPLLFKFNYLLPVLSGCLLLTASPPFFALILPLVESSLLLPFVPEAHGLLQDYFWAILYIPK